MIEKLSAFRCVVKPRRLSGIGYEDAETLYVVANTMGRAEAIIAKHSRYKYAEILSITLCGDGLADFNPDEIN